jgi:DNA polymerase III alpha subunit (gram-positive type)
MRNEQQDSVRYIRNQNYLALDLELNKDDQDNLTKIIQVGVAVGNPTDPSNIKTWSWYLNPGESISSFITDLTGITDDLIKEKSVPLAQVAEELGQIIKDNNVFINPIQWGGGDSDQLLAEFREGGIKFPYFGRRILDVKTLFVFLEMANGRSPSGGLSSSMGKYKIKFEGKAHRAEVDAYNTLKFFFHLIGRQNTLENTIETLKGIKY